MAAHGTELNLLHDYTAYRRIQVLWTDFSDAYAVFDENTPTQPLFTQKFWEARVVGREGAERSVGRSMIVWKGNDLLNWVS